MSTTAKNHSNRSSITTTSTPPAQATMFSNSDLMGTLHDTLMSTIEKDHPNRSSANATFAPSAQATMPINQARSTATVTSATADPVKRKLTDETTPMRKAKKARLELAAGECLVSTSSGPRRISLHATRDNNETSTIPTPPIQYSSSSQSSTIRAVSHAVPSPAPIVASSAFDTRSPQTFTASTPRASLQTIHSSSDNKRSTRSATVHSSTVMGEASVSDAGTVPIAPTSVQQAPVHTVSPSRNDTGMTASHIAPPLVAGSSTFATGHPQLASTVLGFFDLPDNVRGIIYNETFSVFHSTFDPHTRRRTDHHPFGGHWTAQDNTIFPKRLLLVDRRFARESSELFLRKKMLLELAPGCVSNPPIRFSPSHPQHRSPDHPPLSMLQKAVLDITIDQSGDSVVAWSQKRKPEAVASALSHVIGQMSALQELEVQINVLMPQLVPGSRELFDTADIEVFCPAYAALKCTKSITIAERP